MKNIRILICICVMLLSTNTFAAAQWVSGIPQYLLNDDTYYGGCMVYIAQTPSIDCPANWVSLDCKGELTDKATAARFYDAAQVAKALNKTIAAYITDTKKINGYCLAIRLDT